MSSAATVRARLESSLGERLSATLLLRERTAPQTVTTGVAELDALTGGLPRGGLSEIAGPVSSGRAGVMLATLAAATHRDEICALVDASDSFDPASAQAAGVELGRVLWIRCSEQRRAWGLNARNSGRQRKALDRLEQVLRVTDLLLQSGGFSMVVLDMGDMPATSVRRVPLTSWFRFRRAVEHTQTVLLLLEQKPCARSCASLVVQLSCQAVRAQNTALSHNGVYAVTSHNEGWQLLRSQQADIPPANHVSHAALLQRIRLQAEVVRSWTRKPVQPARACFELAARHG
jgi:hypothetical protein